MNEIHLPMPIVVRLAGPGTIALATLLLLAGPLAWPWRAGLVLTTLTVGLALWRRYLKSRPRLVRVAPNGGLRCTLADDRTLVVQAVHPGIVRPWLLSAQLIGDGIRSVLFVPGPSLAPSAHWALRRAVLGFNAGDQRSAGPQAGGFRGT